MKKKIFSFVFLLIMVVPCFIIFTACGKLKDLKGKTMVFYKVEVVGAIDKTAYENTYKTLSFKFDEKEVTFSDGVNEDVYNYRFNNSKLYIKAANDDAYSTTPYAEISGSNMIISDSVDGGVIKVYFKVK